MTTAAPRTARASAHRVAAVSGHGAAVALHVAAMVAMVSGMLPPHDASRCLLAIAGLVVLGALSAVGVRRGAVPIAHLVDTLAMLAGMAAPLVVGAAHHPTTRAISPAAAVVAVAAAWALARIACGLRARGDLVLVASTLAGLVGMAGVVAS